MWLRQQPCEPARYAPSALLPLLKLELAGLQLNMQLWPDDEAAQTRATNEGLALITLRCAAPADGVELIVDDLATRSHSERVLALGDVGTGAKERALALAVASSLEQSLSEALAPAATSAPASELPPAVAEALRARMQQRLALPRAAEPLASTPSPLPLPSDAPGPVELSAMLRLFPSYSTGLLGVQGGVALALGETLALDLDGEALAGQSELSDAQGTVGRMWLYWLSAGLGLSWRSHELPQLALGPRVRLGYASADASVEREGASAHDDHSPLLSLVAVASLRAPISQGASLLLALDFGYTIVGIVFVGDQARLSGMAGISAGVRAGLAF